MATRVRLLVGTKKGAWIYSSDEQRERWEISEPVMPGWTVYHMAADPRCEPDRLYIATGHWAWGPSVARSSDGGKTWDQRSPGLSFAPDSGRSVASVWNIRPGDRSEPGVVWAGTQPAGLFRSEDWGDTWQGVDSLNNHEYHKFWGETGGGSSCLHSIEVDPRDPKRMITSISTGGNYETKDGGQTWELGTHGIVATNPGAKQMWEDFMQRFPEMAGEFENRELPENVDPAALNEMHKLRMDLKQPDRMWGQAHDGVFRSDDGGISWQDVTVGLPSFHGFPIAVTKNGSDAVFVVPLAFEDDNFRVSRNQLTVWRTRDEGATWEPLTNGLPGPNNFQSVYREGLDTDGLDNEAVYLGTSNGEVYVGLEQGERWLRLPGTLPPILSVTVAVD